MNTLKWLPLILVFTVGCSPQDIPEGERLYNDVAYLASDDLEGRETGYAGEAKAGEFLAARFADLGLESKGDSSYFQAFSFKPHPPVQKHGEGDTATLGMAIVKELTGRNVIGFLNNNKPTTIIIGAHYDHLGWGDMNSLHTGEKAIHNGADDNASGVGALLMIVERLQKYTNNNYLIMAFSGEEKGLYGSSYFCDHPTIDLSTVNCMLNMDMVGRLNAERTLAVYGVGTSPSWVPMLESIDVDSISITTTESGVGPSDHTSFYLEDLPVLHFFTGQHEDYHKPTDDVDKVNFDGIVSVVNYMEAVLAKIDVAGRLEFTKTVDKDEDSTPSFNVTLGIMPDYMYSDPGFRIDGVQEGKTANKAGLLKGDIVMKMDTLKVNDIYDYMKGLSIYKSGDTTVFEIIRDGQTQLVDVVWD